MKKILPVFLLFCIQLSFAQTVYKDYVDGRVYVKFTKSALRSVARENPDNIPLTKFDLLAKIFVKYSVTKAYKPFYRALDNDILPYILKLEFSDPAKVNGLINELHEISGVEYAEKVPLMKTDILPNDPIFPPHLTQINAANAWNVFNGNSNITVAIVDNAVMWTHSELVGNTYTNSAEIAGNSIDDDGNGYVDDVNGWDAADNDNNAVPTNTAMDHGTHCAGIAGASTNNSAGIAAIGWNIKIIPVKTETDLGPTNAISYGYEGIVYAANANARVISCSWGGGGAAVSEQAVIDYAWNRGCIVIASAGNNGNTVQNYPGAYNRVYCVASVSSSDVKSGFSNYGTWVDISAPGENVYSTTPSATTGTYQTYSGTSMATPLVAGLAGLMLSRCSFMTQTDVLNCISSTAVNIYTLAGNSSYVANSRLGAGRIEAFQAMNCAASFTSTPPIANFRTPFRNVCPLTPVNFYDSSSYAPTTWAWVFQGGTPSTSTLSNPVVQWSTPGTYSVMLTVSNANGSDSETKLSYITVAGPINLPLQEGFQTLPFLPVNWTRNNIWNDNIYWERRTGLGGFATSTVCAMFDNYNINALNQRDEMRTPKYSFSNVANARLRFDVAYARYSATYTDTLEVKLSTDCGTTWSSIYIKGGSTLSTVANDVTSNIFTPTSSQWRRDTIDISLLTAGQGNVMFSFINRGHFGQPIYLDNINLVFPTPTINVTPPATRCTASAFTFTNTSMAAGSYTWTMAGSSPATSTSSNPTFAYASAGIYTVNLLVANGTSTASATRTVNIIAPPLISVNTPTICQGTSAVLTASGAVTYSWTNGPGTAANSVSPLSTSFYTVSGSNAGCSSIQIATVVVDQAPVISVNNASVCSGNGAALTPTGVSNYTWTNGPIGTALSVSPSVTTVYTVTGNNGLCNGTQMATVFVTTTPTVSAANQTMCSGSSTLLTASGATSYLWDTGISTNTLLVAPASNTLYTITGSNSGFGLTCQDTKSVNVTVLATPTVVIAASTTTMCAGGTATLTASSAANYNWSNGANTPSIVVTQVSSGSYSVVGNTGICAASNSITLYVAPAPFLSAFASQSTICSGNAVTLNANGSFTGFVWTDPSSTTGNFVVVNPTITTTYTVFATANNNCNNSAQVTINVNQNPISVVSTTNVNCSNSCSGIATVSTTSALGPYSYYLENAACTMPCNNLCAGVYTMVSIAANSCTSMNTFSILVSSNNPLVSTINFTNATCPTCADGAAAMLVSGGVAPYTFVWTSSANTQSTVTGLLPDCYSVTATDVNGCSVTATTCIAANPGSGVGISSSSSNDLNIKIYPNPATERIIIDYPDSDFNYVLYNGLGQLIEQKLNNQNKTEILLNDFAKGIYFIEVSNGSGTHRTKIVKE